MDPHQIAEPGLGVDFRIGNDDSGYPTTGPARGWRRPTVPAGEDGSIPSISLLAGAQLGEGTPSSQLVTNEQVDVSFKNPINPSTLDIPNKEME